MLNNPDRICFRSSSAIWPGERPRFSATSVHNGAIVCLSGSGAAATRTGAGNGSRGAALSKVSAKLAKLGLAREIEAKPGAPIWGRDEAGQGYALKLTAAGLKAIAVDEGSPDAIEPGEAPQPQAKNGASPDEGGPSRPERRPALDHCLRDIVSLASRRRRNDWHSVRKGVCVWIFRRREGAARQTLAPAIAPIRGSRR
jgi:hypothetical protein